jgi:hypothetical protein
MSDILIGRTALLCECFSVVMWAESTVKNGKCRF